MSGKANRGIVDIRLALSFHAAPDVHTLLYLTPSRERGKLLVDALQHLIKTTGHPAGLRDVQLKAVDAWLSGKELSLAEIVHGTQLGDAPPEQKTAGSSVPAHNRIRQAGVERSGVNMHRTVKTGGGARPNAADAPEISSPVSVVATERALRVDLAAASDEETSADGSSAPVAGSGTISRWLED